MLNLSEISRVGKKALAWNSKPTEESFPELPEVLVRVRCAFVSVNVLSSSSPHNSYFSLYAP